MPTADDDAAIPDLRDTLAPDPTERADPAHRRRVPPPDEVTATVDRAHLVLTEVADRRAAEQAAADHAAELEPDDQRSTDDAAEPEDDALAG